MVKSGNLKEDTVVVKLPNDNYLDADGEISEQELIDLCNWSYPVKLGKTNENGKFIEEIKLVLTELEAFNIFYGFDEQEHIKDEDEQEVQEIMKTIINI